VQGVDGLEGEAIRVRGSKLSVTKLSVQHLGRNWLRRDLTSKPQHNFQWSITFEYIQMSRNLKRSTFSAYSIGTSVIDATQELDVTVLAWAPLASGRLTSNLATSSRHRGNYETWIVRIVDGVRVLRQQRLYWLQHTSPNFMGCLFQDVSRQLNTSAYHQMMKTAPVVCP